MLKPQLTCKTFHIDETVIFEGNWTSEHIYFNAPGFVLSRMKVPSEDRVKQQRRMEKILPVFALKAVMYKNPCLFSERTSGGKQLWAGTCKM